VRVRERLAGEVPLPTAVLVLGCVLVITLAGSWWWTMPPTPIALQIRAERAVGHAQLRTPAPRPDPAPQAPPPTVTPATWTLWEVFEHSGASDRTTSESGRRSLGDGLTRIDCLNVASTRLQALRGNVSGLQSAVIRNGVTYRTDQGNFSWKFVCLPAGESP
jgi:hypothetical protein